MHKANLPTSLFNYFNLYRFVIASLLFGMTFSKQFLLSEFLSAGLFQFLAAVYFAINAVTLIAYRYFITADKTQIFTSVFIDILILHGLFFAGDGITGGLSNLAIISVAAANIMLRGAIAYSVAALASLLSLSVEIEFYSHGMGSVSNLARAGLAGSVYFATAFLVQYLSARISQSELLAEKREQDIAELQELNHQIIQSMRTGIIVCNDDYRVRVLNQACHNLLGLNQNQALPRPLRDSIKSWKSNPQKRTKPFQVSSELPVVQANFSRMDESGEPQILIFLEDTRLLTQKAQQLKLASLGRLTASIAHEVRNPLGAISHATQLLVESDTLAPADRKMTDIIERHCLRMNNIIESTLSLSRRAKPDIQETELKTWLEKVLNNYRVHDESFSRLKLEILNEHAKARFDQGQLEQALTNLINNALRHSEQSEPDTVVVQLSQNTENKQASIEVIDFGAGVPKADQKHLFEPFFTTESSGTGLGLYLSRELCEVNQAQLSYIDRENTGAVFNIMFAHYKRLI